MNYLRFRVLFGLGLSALALSLALCAQAQTVTFLAGFNGQNGYLPLTPVVQATDGNFYGTTYGFWESNIGNVYRVTPQGALADIYKFCSQANCADGNVPSALVLGGDGNLYGAASQGGSTAGSPSGSGTLFKMTLDGEITILHTFCTSTPCTDGEGPLGLAAASDGNFYGTTNTGGSNNAGTLFRISPAGDFNVVYAFCSEANCADGSGPAFAPIEGADGKFYGTTYAGGSLSSGVAYQITPSGTNKVLYNFCNSSGFCPDGGYLPMLTQGANGNFYGITEAGGSYNNGVVFELTASGKYSVLHSFVPYQRDNVYVGFPSTPLTLASDGNLYGTVGGGPPWSWDAPVEGALFEITSAGRYKQLPLFKLGPHVGYNPLAPLFQSTDGSFYGTTAYGGLLNRQSDYGTVFQFSNGLSPLVKTVPGAAQVGQSVIILGNGLTGTTSVTFNGVEAAFTVESDTYIKATVPAGATSGTVSVVTPSGTLNSNPQFVVTK